MKCLTTLATALLCAQLAAFGQAPAQSKTPTRVIIADYNERSTHCRQDPSDDLNCDALKTTTGLLGLPRTCPNASAKDQIGLTIFSMNLRTLDGVDAVAFEKMRWCKLSSDEAGMLHQWHLSRMPTRVFYDTKSRSDSPVYVTATFEQGTPDTAKSAFRAALRQIGDVEAVDTFDADFVLDVGVMDVKSQAESSLGYAALVSCTTLERTPGNSPFSSSSKLVECEHFPNLIRLMPQEGLDSNMREIVASVDADEFEAFRKSWPYQLAKIK
jgi:hypothetical protein